MYLGCYPTLHSGRQARNRLFLEDPDYLYMLVLLKNFSRRHAIDIYAFCLMAKHMFTS